MGRNKRDQGIEEGGHKFLCGAAAVVRVWYHGGEAGKAVVPVRRRISKGGKYGVIRRAAFQKPRSAPILMITQRNFD